MLRDLAILGFLLWLLAMGLRRPWMLTFAYLYVDLLQPQRIGFGLLNDAPISFIFALLAVAAFFFERKKSLRFGAIQALMVAFILWFTLTTQWAILPDSRLWDKWDASWKSVGFAAFIPFVLVTRRRIEAVVALIVLAVGLVASNAAIKTLLGGGGYGTLSMIVETNKGIYESSVASTLAVTIVPLAFYLARYSHLLPKARLFQLLPWGIAFSAALVTIGSEARTGFVCLAALAGMMFWASRRKIAFAFAGLALAIVALPFLPQNFIDRMKTIGTYQQDTSASARTEVWKWTLQFVKEHPFGGGFQVFRINSIEINIPQYAPDGVTLIGTRTKEQRARAFHSAYFEVLGEHGYLGFGIWLSILLLTQWQLHRVRQRFRNLTPEDAWIPALARAVAQSIAVYMVGALFTGIAFQTSLYTFIAVSVSLIHYVEARDARFARDRRLERFRARLHPGALVPAR